VAAVAAVTVMPVEQMKEWASEDKHEGQVLHHVSPMLGEQEVARYQGESEEYPAT
jgi:hypothetical protein